MITPISGPMNIAPANPVSFAPVSPPQQGEKAGESFGAQLTSLFSDVNQQQVQADAAIKNFLTGQGGEIHQVMLAMEQARLSTMVAVEVRNKLVDAYQEISRMPV